MPLSDALFETRIARHVQLPYLLYTVNQPAPPEGYPLLLFLHGSGERGTDLSLLRQHSLPRLLADGLDFPGLVLMPQCPPNSIWSLFQEGLIALLNDIQDHFAVDAARICLMGLSMGGAGAWDLVLHSPDVFAGLVAICPPNRWIFGYPDQLIHVRHIPVWQFHGETDSVVAVEDSRELASVFRALGGEIRLTIYSNTGHNAWKPAFQEPELWPWLLNLRRQAPETSQT
ncbi:MAG: dienelactone hydrolase family protein [Anaerolineales bacterium]